MAFTTTNQSCLGSRNSQLRYDTSSHGPAELARIEQGAADSTYLEPADHVEVARHVCSQHLVDYLQAQARTVWRLNLLRAASSILLDCPVDHCHYQLLALTARSVAATNA